MERISQAASSLSILLAITSSAVAQSTPGNSNLWPVHRDQAAGFRISYPPGWVIVPAKGRNVRFSVTPPKGAGNCNVVARANPELAAISQVQLNLEIESLPTDQASWAEYLGLQPSQVRVLETRRARTHQVPALIGTVETTLENLEGKFTRKQMIVMTFTPGFIWSLNCGASTFQASEARARFNDLQPTFNKVFGSFAFLK